MKPKPICRACMTVNECVSAQVFIIKFAMRFLTHKNVCMKIFGIRTWLLSVNWGHSIFFLFFNFIIKNKQSVAITATNGKLYNKKKMPRKPKFYPLMAKPNTLNEINPIFFIHVVSIKHPKINAWLGIFAIRTYVVDKKTNYKYIIIIFFLNKNIRRFALKKNWLRMHANYTAVFFLTGSPKVFIILKKKSWKLWWKW